MKTAELINEKILEHLPQLLAFFADRLKVQLRDQGARHDLVDAVFALEGQDDLVLIVRRVEALAAFLDTDDGRNLLAGTKRAANILRIEEKKDGRAFDGAPDPALFRRRRRGRWPPPSPPPRRTPPLPSPREDFAGAMARAGQAARSRRHLLRQGDGERRRQGRPREPPEAPERNPRRHPHRRRLQPHRGLSAFPPSVTRLGDRNCDSLRSLQRPTLLPSDRRCLATSSGGTLPPVAASFVITCSCGQTFIVLNRRMSPSIVQLRRQMLSRRMT